MAGGERIVVDGQCFHSEREYHLFVSLQKLVKDGRVAELEVHPSYPLIANQTTVSQYQPTFRLVDCLQHQERFIQVVSGTSNPLRSLKQKWFEAMYGVRVEEWS
jgi:hypothetical protein